jgi:hypothetical protein
MAHQPRWLNRAYQPLSVVGNSVELREGCGLTLAQGFQGKAGMVRSREIVGLLDVLKRPRQVLHSSGDVRIRANGHGRPDVFFTACIASSELVRLRPSQVATCM